ncbi:hypothetical protein [Rickettsiales endosymbiont of Stachyamoeba lipophora]|uniref:hypothetical protein n=1 Tax=Rickettsiales endosymbiont of Stachyamoeba lipophora TaxID=2486578 RepID=UPI000F64E376|nr:hypothetical protein [Rickettsiales endosymbiont of Stachyamoeba lipophora]AZL15085.1 hypothetical protein EF513_00710 [Rickettsiales endosymbiont of Stachyamoeba lipophora]
MLDFTERDKELLQEYFTANTWRPVKVNNSDIIYEYFLDKNKNKFEQLDNLCTHLNLPGTLMESKDAELAAEENQYYRVYIDRKDFEDKLAPIFDRKISFEHILTILQIEGRFEAVLEIARTQYMTEFYCKIGQQGGSPSSYKNMVVTTPQAAKRQYAIEALLQEEREENGPSR